MLPEAFRFAFDNIEPTDAVVVGMFHKHKDQARENCRIGRDVLHGRGR